MLEEEREGQQCFRWTNLAGPLEEYAGCSVDQHPSPSAICVGSRSAQLFCHAERYFPSLAKLHMPFAESLLVPFVVNSNVTGAVWIVSHSGGRQFDLEDLRVVTNLAGFAGRALTLVRLAEIEQQARRALETEIEQHRQTERSLRQLQSQLESVIDSRTAQLRELSAKLLTIQDHERRHIARELHDSTGQYLAILAMELRTLMRDHTLLNSSQQRRLADALRIVDRCSSEIRTISYLLHPPMLDELGLASAISVYLEGFAKRSGMQVRFECAENLGRFPRDIEIALFRAVQQCLVNIHHHSGSRTAEVRLSSDDGVIKMQIRDSGRGMPPEVLAKILKGGRLSGVGIAGMRERVRMLDGQFDVTSGPGGTVIDITLPVRMG